MPRQPVRLLNANRPRSSSLPSCSTSAAQSGQDQQTSLHRSPKIESAMRHCAQGSLRQSPDSLRLHQGLSLVTPVGPVCAALGATADCLSEAVPGSLRMSLEAAVAADQMCRLPEASQEAMWGVLLAPPNPSQHRPDIRLLCPVYCTSAEIRAHTCNRFQVVCVL